MQGRCVVSRRPSCRSDVLISHADALSLCGVRGRLHVALHSRPCPRRSPFYHTRVASGAGDGEEALRGVSSTFIEALNSQALGAWLCSTLGAVLIQPRLKDYCSLLATMRSIKALAW